jgi:hypothetical protein
MSQLPSFRPEDQLGIDDRVFPSSQPIGDKISRMPESFIVASLPAGRSGSPSQDDLLASYRCEAAQSDAFGMRAKVT